jgi:hypothetical protein
VLADCLLHQVVVQENSCVQTRVTPSALRLPASADLCHGLHLAT